MEFLISEAQILLQKTLRDFLDRACPPQLVRKWDDEASFPSHVWKELGEQGWLSLPISKEYGGRGGTALDTALLVEELTCGCGALGFAVTLLSLNSLLLERFGTVEQKTTLLPRLARGDVHLALAMTEPSAGTDILSLSTTAEKAAGGYILDGQKTWTSLGSRADWLVVLARTSTESKRSQGLTLFLVGTKTPGLTIRPFPKTAYKAIDANQVFFHGVETPASSVIGEVGMGFQHLMSSLDNERIGAACLALGNATAAFEQAREHALGRRAFGRVIGQFQAIQHYLARMSVQIESARLMVYRAAWLQSIGAGAELAALQAKVAASECAVQVTSDALRILGSRGLTEDNDAQRYFRDARVSVVSPISNEMALNVIAQKLGMPKSY